MRHQPLGVTRVVLTTGATRPHLRGPATRALPAMAVLSHHEILPPSVEPVGLLTIPPAPSLTAV